MSGANSPGPAPVVLSVEGVTKRFGALLANDDISFQLRRGEVLALLGENGAGKTTLMSILSGHYVGDGGRIMVAPAPDGPLAPLPPGAPAASLAAGIGMVHQHFALAESLTALENIVLGTRGLAAPSLRLRRAAAAIERLMVESGLRVNLGARISRLSLGEKQRVELLRVLYRVARILVLDEPTAVLAPEETEGLFRVLRGLARGGLAVIFISHKLREVLEIADRVLVLRGGRAVADQPVGGADRRSLARLMVGREITASRREPQPPGEALLVLDRVAVAALAGRTGLAEASLTLHAGEIVGIAGVSGNGQGALAANGPDDARRVAAPGLARIPEERHREGIVGSMSVAENLCLETLASLDVQRLGFLRLNRMRELARTAIAAYDIRCPGPDAPAGLLSSGNIQQVILARVLGGQPGIVLANQPTRGLDVGAAGVPRCC